jgi:hypothetical protein
MKPVLPQRDLDDAKTVTGRFNTAAAMNDQRG